MVETITPAGCGSRRRYRIALALFALGAVLASAALGALLGLAGSAFYRTLAPALGPRPRPGPALPPAAHDLPGRLPRRPGAGRPAGRGRLPGALRPRPRP